MARDYKKEYARDQASPAQIQARAQRNAARVAVEKKVGNLPKTQEVDHKKPIANGGTNAAENLRVVSRHTNRVKGKR